MWVCLSQKKKTLHREEAHWLSCKKKKKKKIAGTSVKKEGHSDSLWDMKRFLSVDFLEKSAIVSNDSYYQSLRQYSPYLLSDLYIYESTH